MKNTLFITLFVSALLLFLTGCYIQGPEGRMGPIGPQGAQGEKGEKGDKGDKGDTGSIGAPGKDGKDGEQGLPGKDGKDGKDGTSSSTLCDTGLTTLSFKYYDTDLSIRKKYQDHAQLGNKQVNYPGKKHPGYGLYIPIPNFFECEKRGYVLSVQQSLSFSSKIRSPEHAYIKANVLHFNSNSSWVFEKNWKVAKGSKFSEHQSPHVFEPFHWPSQLQTPETQTALQLMIRITQEDEHLTVEGTVQYQWTKTPKTSNTKQEISCSLGQSAPFEITVTHNDTSLNPVYHAVFKKNSKTILPVNYFEHCIKDHDLDITVHMHKSLPITGNFKGGTVKIYGSSVFSLKKWFVEDKSWEADAGVSGLLSELLPPDRHVYKDFTYWNMERMQYVCTLNKQAQCEGGLVVEVVNVPQPPKYTSYKIYGKLSLQFTPR